MGCDIDRRNNYAESSYDIESKIREWELNLGTFQKKIYDLSTKINSKWLERDKIDESNLITFFNIDLKDSNFKEIFNKDIFRENGQKGAPYDLSVIKKLFFLITQSNEIRCERGSYQDKLQFVYTNVFNESELYDQPIDIHDFNFKNLLKTLVELSTVVLVGIKKLKLDAYAAEDKTVNTTTELFKLRENQDTIVEGIIEELKVKTAGNTSVTFNDFNNFFRNDPWV